MADLFDDKNFGDETEAKSQTVDWGTVGDYIAGTFIRARHSVETQFGPNSIYEFLAERGQFHKLTKKKPAADPTILNKGEMWNVWGRNEIFNGTMNNLKPGQVVKITYAEDKPTQMGEAKIVKIFTPKNNDGSPIMNDAWVESQGVTAGQY